MPDTDPNPEFSRYFNASVDDAKSSLACRFDNLKAHEVAEEERFAEALLEACPPQKVSLRKVISTHLNKLLKKVWEPEASPELPAPALLESPAPKPWKPWTSYRQFQPRKPTRSLRSSPKPRPICMV